MVIALVAAPFVLPAQKEVVREITSAPSQKVGAASNQISDPCFSFGDVWRCGSAKQLQGDAASTTIAVFQAPQFGSSTMQQLACRLNTGTSTAMSLKVSKSATYWPNTLTQLSGAALAANTMVAYKATSTVIDGTLFGPNDYIIIQSVVSAGGAGTSSPTGACSVDFVTL